MAFVPEASADSGLDGNLIAKYNQAVPRYTSYPTALQFRVIDDLQSQEAMYSDISDNGSISLYFHLPFCQRLCWFCDCSKVISTDERVADRYLDYLEKEIALVRPRIASHRKVVQLHFGGGSPNFLSPSQLDRLSSIIHANFSFEPDAELSVELDPRTLTEEKVATFRRMGINRASVGVQDVNSHVQTAIHRIQSSEMNRQAIKWLQEANIWRINVDLIYGLPYQSAATFSETLDEVLSYDPDRFSIFNYAHVPWIQPAQKILEQSPLPSPEEKIDMLTLAVSRLSAAGYIHIGMDHFTKVNDPLAVAQRTKRLQCNFQGYSLCKDVEICAFGMSSISQTSRIYRQNVRNLDTYYRLLDEGRFPIDRGYILSSDDQTRRRVIMRLMCDMELDFDTLSSEMDIDFRFYFKEELRRMKPLAADGLLCFTDGGLEVTSLGQLLIRNIALVFDAYLGRETEGDSKAV